MQPCHLAVRLLKRPCTDSSIHDRAVDGNHGAVLITKRRRFVWVRQNGKESTRRRREEVDAANGRGVGSGTEGYDVHFGKSCGRNEN